MPWSKRKRRQATVKASDIKDLVEMAKLGADVKEKKVQTVIYDDERLRVIEAEIERLREGQSSVEALWIIRFARWLGRVLTTEIRL